MQIQTKNPNIILSSLELKDAELIFKLVDENRSEFRKWFTWTDNTRDPSSTLSFIKFSNEQAKTMLGLHWKILFNDVIVGVIGLNTIDKTNESAEIGYWMDQRSEGKGIMTVSCRAVIDFCFSELKLNRIVIKTATENYKSAAIPQRLQFSKEGILRQAEKINGEYLDQYLFSLSKSEWR